MERHREAFIPNPLLAGLAGICPVIAVSDGFARGAAMGLGTALATILLGFAVPAFGEMLSERLRAPFALGTAGAFAGLYGLALAAYSPALAAGLELYLPLMAVNCLVLHALRRGVREGRAGAATLVASSLGYLGAMLLIAALREVLGAGTLTLPTPGTRPLTLTLAASPPLRFLSAPAGGFVTLGLFAALYRRALRATGRSVA